MSDFATWCFLLAIVPKFRWEVSQSSVDCWHSLSNICPVPAKKAIFKGPPLGIGN